MVAVVLLSLLLLLLLLVVVVVSHYLCLFKRVKGSLFSFINVAVLIAAHHEQTNVRRL